jgi:diguanylate cyclase (GGDEF)-like protein/PAS domain S-box-containing protein
MLKSECSYTLTHPMYSSVFQRLSLKSRVTLLTLVIFLLSTWVSTLFASRMLRADLEQMLGQQQFSTASLAASQVDEALSSRMKALEQAAERSGPVLLAGPAAMQAWLDQNQLLSDLFNFGVLAYRSDGTAIAESPLRAGRVGLNYMDNATVLAALTLGKSSTSEVQMGKKLRAPVFGMTVPIRNPQGQVVGALSGVIDLGAPNFLDRIIQNRYGKTGGYLLVAPLQRLVVTATDKSRIMEQLPPAGVHPGLDRFINGYEGSAVLVNPQGLEVLVSDIGIPSVGWLLAAVLPAQEAFAPIRALQQHLMLAAVVLTLLAGALTWWMVRRQLAPVLATVKTLATLSGSGQIPQPLPIAHHDEFGALVTGFNGLLQTLAKRETDLTLSAQRYRQLVNDLQVGVLIQSPTSEILMSNQLALDLLGLTLDQLLGKTSFDPDWDVIHEDGSPFPGNTHPVPQAIAMKQAVEDVVMGVFRPASKDRVWLLVTAKPQFSPEGGLQQVVCTFSNISTRKVAEAALEKSEAFKNTVLNSLTAEIAVVDRNGIIRAVNKGWQCFARDNSDSLGKPVASVGVGANYLSVCDADSRSGIEAVLSGLLPEFSLEYPCDSPTQKRWFLMTVVPLGRDVQDGAVITHADISAIKQATQGELHRSHILELLASDQALGVVLEALVLGAEQLQLRALCSILLLSSDGRHFGRGVAPSLPDFYNAALEGLEIGQGVGSCGTAAFTGELVVVEDIATHPYWAPYKDLAASAGLGSCWSQPFRDSRGRVLGTFAIYHNDVHTPEASDIALIEQSARLASIAVEKSLALQQLRDSETRFRTVMEDIVGVAAQGYAMDGTVTFWNRASEQLYGYTAEEAMGNNLLDLIIPPKMRDGVAAAMSAMRVTGQAIAAGELVLMAKGGAAVPVYSSHALVKPVLGQQEFFCLDIDLTERKRMEEQVRQLSFFDPLTLLPNRRMFDDRLKQTMAASNRSGHFGALMFIDLDNFKPINDTHGHEFGDQLLIEVAQRLLACVREVDTVARIGGDEFVVMLSDLTAERRESNEQARSIAEKIRVSLVQPYVLTVRHDGKPDITVEHHCSASLGVALFINHESSPYDILKRADAAMYLAKDAGRNQVCTYEEPAGGAA